MNWHLKSFEELTNDQLYKIMKARVDVFVVEQSCPYPELDDYDQIAMHYFLEIDQNIAAYVRLMPANSRYELASIGRVIVTKPYRHNGYARDIMEKAKAYIVQEWQETQIKIQAQQYLQNFYESLGFEQISDMYLEDNIPHIDMVWQLK
ncbi:GNAT family N-acetyltransferase [Lentibacillus saliphilus]|uniref:GNAT family N-acetyltransferase n=1 Tax=Lentibacillus saliphilus TaxID=2737028 RepID=UPI001C2F9995|nr:GNAT family N-acetyltransferase [Lentibacillus saliphilus]